MMTDWLKNPQNVGNIVGTQSSPIDPRFITNVTLGNNWKNWDLRLAAGSPAIDKGSNTLAVDVQGNPLVRDLNGDLRIKGGTVDIGAYEFATFITVDKNTSLYKAIADAQGKMYPTVKFAPNQTIALDGKEVYIDNIKNLAIDGYAANITINGYNEEKGTQSRVTVYFHIPNFPSLQKSRI